MEENVGDVGLGKTIIMGLVLKQDTVALMAG
jgi:hypothetical protein